MGRHGTIANRKASQDSKRAQIFTKYARAIIVAARNGGDPEYNMALKHAIDKAKSINMPNDNINRAIKKEPANLPEKRMNQEASRDMEQAVWL